MTSSREPIERYEHETATLMAEHQPVWRRPNKRVVYEIACPPGAAHRGRLACGR